VTRKEFLTSLILSAAAPAALAEGQDPPLESDITLEDLKAVEKVVGIEFTDAERQQVLRQVQGFRRGYDSVRSLSIPNAQPPAVTFKPLGRQPSESSAVAVRHREMPSLARPGDGDLAFMTVAELSQLVKQKKVSPVELTALALQRLETHGPRLLNVVTVTRELALQQAQKAESEIMAGNYRGPLHGIPYALKDLFAVRGYPTTWGSAPHKEQVFDYDCAVFEKLTESGAVCCAKTSMGSLAQGDVWFAGRTQNPWNTQQGSSGSSAGSASCMAAGLVPFTIGTETQGSIVSPSARCRVTGLRPTFGRVSRYGAMTLSWSMDKAGPICRTAEDCMLVLASLNGSDPRDPGSVDRPLLWTGEVDVASLKIGVLQTGQEPVDYSAEGEFEDYIALLKKLGAKLQNVRFSQMPAGVSIDLAVESAAAFDDFTRGDAIDGLQNSAWPNTFRAHRYVPAVEYLQALRARTEVMRKFEEEFADFDLVVAPGTGNFLLMNTNRTGHPQLYVPNGVDAQGSGRGFSLFGRLYDESTICSLGWRMQQETGFFRARPQLN
jgi:Asp-tRNA(Asn)/Glu-tRNA(Gln) amidotransferase A subunit family amidase